MLHGSPKEASAECQGLPLSCWRVEGCRRHQPGWGLGVFMLGAQLRLGDRGGLREGSTSSENVPGKWADVGSRSRAKETNPLQRKLFFRGPQGGAVPGQSPPEVGGLQGVTLGASWPEQKLDEIGRRPRKGPRSGRRN